MWQDLEFRPGSAGHAREVARCIKILDEGDGVLFASSDAEIAERALRSFAGRGLRRAKAIACMGLLLVTTAISACDGNVNGRADIFDLAAAASEIAGFDGAVTTWQTARKCCPVVKTKGSERTS